MMNHDSSAYQRYRVAQERFSCTPGALAADQRVEVDRIVLRKLKIESAVLGSADAVGVIVPDAAVADAFAQIQARFQDEGELQAALLDAGVDEDGLREALGRELKVEAVLERVGASVAPVSETDARLYYYMHANEFRRPERRTARHILVTVNPDFPENERGAALRRIEEIGDRLRRKPERFAEQALKHSECPTSLQGGLLGTVVKGNLFPALEQVLFAMEEGALSGVVESPLGFHLLFCEGIEPEAAVPLEDILPRLREKLEQRQRAVYQRRWLEELLTSASAAEVEGRESHG